jgi:diaminopimelate epimerase
VTTRPFSPERPRAGLGFFKAHGLGNDYLVVEPGTDWTLSVPSVQAVCHRTRGAGSDGVIWVDPEAPPFSSRMFNPDGSEFERSGNGLRILAAHLHRSGRVGAEPFPVVVGGESVTLQVLGEDRGHFDVAVEMGRARTGPLAVSLAPDRLSPVGDGSGQGTLDTREGALTLSPVSVGNPHAVLWGDPEPWRWRALDDPEALADLHRYGPTVATDPGFAGGTNVQLARVESDGRLHALVWERGVGRTSASGTSACAVAVAAVSSGRVEPGELEVVMEGGVLRVRVGAGLEVRLRGPVESVMEGRLAPGLVTG